MIGKKNVIHRVIVVKQKMAIAVQTAQCGFAHRHGCVKILYAAVFYFVCITAHGKYGDDHGKTEKENKGSDCKITEYFMEIIIISADNGLDICEFHGLPPVM